MVNVKQDRMGGVDNNKEIAIKKLHKLYGKNIVIVFGKIRADGTRSVKFKAKGLKNVQYYNANHDEWSSYSYLTDIQ